MKGKRVIFLIILIFILGVSGFWAFHKFNSRYTIGQKIDSFNGVNVYYNGKVDNVLIRNTTKDGYNLGLKYQCVEFVKRYYYEHLNHKMPDSYGHAKDFFDRTLADDQMNRTRNLRQFTNGSRTKPKVNDLLIFDKSTFNKYGHVAIISKVERSEIEIIQQNPGAYSDSRETLSLISKNEKWTIDNKRILGWLRKDD